MSEDTSPNRLHKILNRLSITRTPSRSSSLRSRRGVLTMQELELQVNDLNLDDQKERKSGEPVGTVDLSSTTPSRAVYPRQTMQAESVRRRERIAELRRRRLNNFYDFQQEHGNTENTTDERSPPRGFALSPPISSRITTAVDSGSPIPVIARQNSTNLQVSSSLADRFYNSPELKLLLHRIDIESIDGLDENDALPPSKRPQSNRKPPATTSPLAKENEMDFTIDIPSTSLSPVVANGRTMLLRRRSRTTAPTQQKSFGKRKGISRLFVSPNRESSARSQTMANGMTEDSAKDDEDDVLAKLDAARARNLKLRKELHGLSNSINALSKLFVANQVIGRDDSIRGPYPPLFAD